MDAFFASVEQRDNPGLKGKPVAVGGERSRGVVAAASYEARKFGVHSAMSSVTAKKKCPDLIFVKPRFNVYREVSLQIRNIFFDYTDLVEPLSLDEAFLDVTLNKINEPVATNIAKEIKLRIKSETGLTSSAGVSFNKFLAKIASDYNKPDGLYVIKPQAAEYFIENLAIEKFFGIGRVTSQKMHEAGIYTGKDLKQISLNDLIIKYGKPGEFYYNIVRGIDSRPVNPKRIRKSVGTEITFDNDLQSIEEILFELKNVENELLKRIEKTGACGRTMTLKVKFEDFEQITRSKSQNSYFSTKNIHSISVELASSVNYRNKGVRLLGLTLSNLESNENDSASQLEFDFD